MAMADGRYGDIDSIFDIRDGGMKGAAVGSAVGEKGKAPVECRHHLPTTSKIVRIAASAVAGSLLGVCMVVPGNRHHFQFKFSFCRLERGCKDLPKVGKSRSSERWGFRVRRGQNRVWLETAGLHWMAILRPKNRGGIIRA
ncbi:hypothetical protein M747DRAFT_249230 [Aspergillus niger ATCC 13496]|uniref:Uncharacterized protein n=3 Tax=Aspergillus niger TaxID=5061 RepID=A2QZV8_ASPNC|nr:hypothetical protein An12g06370 [Aspergillus niger]RDH14573.1 hypothetical protein M747DRAFT_249230 [Aspergillus niger ATCC 13496]CAK41170.1 hypothetical protein An12g06370 [Aspergillus niger]